MAQQKKKTPSKNEKKRIPFCQRIRQKFADANFRKKGSRFLIFAMLTFLVAAWGWFLWTKYSELSAAPQVLAGNFSLEYRKIPFDVPSVDFTLSQDIDASSVNASTFTVSPALSGYATVKNGNIVSFALSEKMSVGSRYVFTLSKDIASSHGKPLGKDYVIELEAVAWVKVARAVPSGETSALSKNPVFIFNIPVVALSSLAEKDEIPCPVKFEPQVDGRCSWISGNVLEYVLEKPLLASSKYRVTVENSTGFLYPMKEAFEGEFSTPELSAIVLTGAEVPTFSPKDGMTLRFNADVDAEVLSKKLVLLEEASQKSVPFKISAVSGWSVSNALSITGRDGPLDHSTTYVVRVSEGLMPAFGNLPMKKGAEWKFRSNDFISNVVVKYGLFSETGALLDTPEVYSEGRLAPVIPARNGILSIEFDEAVSFGKDFARILGEKGETLSECVLSAFDRSVSDSQGKETKRTGFKCEIKTPLPYGAKVRLSVSKAASPSLKADATKDFVVSPEFSVSGFKAASPTEACLYSTTPLQNDPGFLVTVPASKTRDVFPDGRWEWKDGESREVFSCPKIEGKRAYVASVRLNPNTEYSVKFAKGATDSYGNRLQADAEFPAFTTGNVSEKDRYLYSSATKDLNVIPTDAGIVVWLQSVNLTAAKIEACETDALEYFRFAANPWKSNYHPTCFGFPKSKVVPLQNRHWQLSPAQVDVESDILGREAESPFVFVRWTSSDRFNLSNGGYRDSDREFAHFFVRSNLSITLEQGGDRGHLFAVSYDGKETPSDLAFETYSYDYESGNPVSERAKIVWNAKKSSYEIAKTAKPIAFIVAKNAKYFGVLAVNSDSVSNYDFGYVSGQDSAMRDYAYVYGDRPIYRTGDTVHFKGILRRFLPEGYAPSPLKDVRVRILDQDGQMLKELPLKTDRNSHFVGSFELPAWIKTGRYDFAVSAAAKAGEEPLYVHNDANFFVEQYVKPAFKVTASETLPDALPKEKVSIPFSAQYYFWGSLAMAEYSVRVMSQNYFFDPREHSAYRFGTASSNYDCVYWGYCYYSDQFVENLSGKLDANGRGILQYEMPEFGPEDGEKLYSFHIETTDPDTGRTINQTVTKVLHRTDANVGVRSPYWVNKGDPIPAEGIVLDHSAKPLANKSVRVEFVRREWKEVKKLGIDGTYYSENEIVETVEKTLSATSDSEGKFRAEYRPEKGGEFEIRAVYRGKNGMETTSSEYAYAATEDYVAWGGTNNSLTTLVAEKTVLKPGEKAAFTLKTPVNSGKAFITVEKDDAVLDVFVRDVTSYAERIEIPIDSRHIPNAYVKVFVIGKAEGAVLPTYKRALSVVKVLPDEKRLSITVTADRDRKSPGEPLTVAVFVKDALGNPVKNANGSLSVVDQSVLALLGNPKKNPFAFFYEMKRYLGVQTSLSLANLVEKLEVKSAALQNGAKWGAGEDRKGGDTQKKRGTFKDTAFWRADFTTDANGKFSVTTDALPDNLTTWVVEAVVSTSADNRIGVGQTSVVTAKEVMVSENLPRIFRSGDKTVLSPVVFNRTWADAEFEVSLSSEGLSVEKPARKLRIANGASETVAFPVTVSGVPSGKDRTAVKVSFAAKTGTKSDSVEKTVPVFRSEMWETTATVGSTRDASFDERLNLSGIDKSRSELSVRYSATLFANAADGLEHLLAYPYGCVEQKTSAIIPHVVSKRLSDALWLPFDLDAVKVAYVDAGGSKTKTVREALSDYVASMSAFVRGDGGFGYWPEAPKSDFAMTAHVVKTLSQIRSLGIAVDQKALSDASAYLKREFYANKRPYCFAPPASIPSSPEADSCGYSASERLSAVSAVLGVKPDDYEAYKMWKLLDVSSLNAAEKSKALGVLSDVSKISSLNAADTEALSKASDSIFDELLKTALVYDSRGAFIAASPSDGGRIRASAAFLESAVKLGKDQNELSQVLDNVSRFLSKSRRSDGSYGSTLDTVAVLSAFAARAASDASGFSNMVVKAGVNGENVIETGISKGDVTKFFEKRIPLSALPTDSTVNFVKTGTGKLYYDLSLSYPVPAENLAARDEGMFVSTAYYDEADYRRIEALKRQETALYDAGKIRYDELKYPKSAYEYLDSVKSFRVGQLVRVKYRVILAETRDRVAFESFVPAGAEVVNTRLATESKIVAKDTFFEREEFLDDRYFGYSERLEPGDYEGSYVFRATHAGDYSVPPTRAFEFYAPETFGRSSGGKLSVSAR